MFSHNDLFIFMVLDARTFIAFCPVSIAFCTSFSIVSASSKVSFSPDSSGMRTLKTHFETVSDWSVVKWSVLIGQSPRPRD